MARGRVNYNFDLLEFPSEEAPGISVFYKDGNGEVFHTFSAYARGTEMALGTYTTSISYPRVVTKTVWPLRCRGSATMTGTMMATWRLPRGRIGPRAPFQTPEVY